MALSEFQTLRLLLDSVDLDSARDRSELQFSLLDALQALAKLDRKVDSSPLSEKACSASAPTEPQTPEPEPLEPRTPTELNSPRSDVTLEEPLTPSPRSSPHSASASPHSASEAGVDRFAEEFPSLPSPVVKVAARTMSVDRTEEIAEPEIAEEAAPEWAAKPALAEPPVFDDTELFPSLGSAAKPRATPIANLAKPKAVAKVSCFEDKAAVRKQLQAKDRREKTRVAFPAVLGASECGRVLGQQGCHLKRLEQDTGARFSVQGRFEAGPHVLVEAGASKLPHAVERIEAHLDQVARDFEAYLNRSEKASSVATAEKLESRKVPFPKSWAGYEREFLKRCVGHKGRHLTPIEQDCGASLSMRGKGTAYSPTDTLHCLVQARRETVSEAVRRVKAHFLKVDQEWQDSK